MQDSFSLRDHLHPARQGHYPHQVQPHPSFKRKNFVQDNLAKVK
jgi:hypothetical protein